MDIGFYKLRKFGRFIKRLYRWLPVLWQLEDWDYMYIYPVLKLKLEELQKCLKEDDLHVNAPKYARQIEICLKYMDRFVNPDNYIKLPQDGISFEKTENGATILKTSKKLGRVAVQSYNFEQENFRMFWKRFEQWHRNWWC